MFEGQKNRGFGFSSALALLVREGDSCKAILEVVDDGEARLGAFPREHVQELEDACPITVPDPTAAGAC